MLETIWGVGPWEMIITKKEENTNYVFENRHGCLAHVDEYADVGGE